MVMYMSKGGFRVEVMLFSLYKKSYELMLMMQLFILCIWCPDLHETLPRDPNSLDVDICGPLILGWNFPWMERCDWDWKE